ncbi:MAG: N-acetylmuramoyl-L-alanine amidase [Chthonomonas sp.]|nr:N-acetylmuramoyl-L-alanine amidase [Chthonomonas sp.]
MHVLRSGWTVAAALAAVVGWAQPDYASALWNPAYSGNYSTSNRPSTYPITHVVIHIMEGTYSGSISWFQNPSSNVSAHYMVRSSDGQITQMVREKDIAWHAGVTFYNQQAVGIEHEATSTSTSWYTDNLYWASARLTRYLTAKYNIPLTRTYIIGHRETGRATTCPGPYWDFDNKYMPLLKINATAGTHTFPVSLSPNVSGSVVVRMNNTGVDDWLSLGNDPVFLDTYPAGRVSTFANSWINTTRPSSVFQATPGGTTGEFRFNITAPGTQGYYEEEFQLNRTSVGRFGPVIKLGITVGQTDKAVDNTSTDFTTTGTWSTGTTAVGKYGSDYRFSTYTRKTGAKATWKLGVVQDGFYDVYAWWPAGTNRGASVVYDVDDLIEGALAKPFNQQVNGGQWNLIGRVRLMPGRDYVRMTPVTRSGADAQVAIADAVRVVGPF